MKTQPKVVKRYRSPERPSSEESPARRSSGH
jgi:hypothetical protein